MGQSAVLSSPLRKLVWIGRESFGAIFNLNNVVKARFRITRRVVETWSFELKLPARERDGNKGLARGSGDS